MEGITLGGHFPPFLRGQFYRFFQYNGKIAEIEISSGSKSSIQNCIKHGKKQADFVLVRIPDDMDINTANSFVKGQMKHYEGREDLKVMVFNSSRQQVFETKIVTNDFLPVKNIEEAINRAKLYGIKEVEFSNAKLDHINTVLSALHDEQKAAGNITLDKLIFSDGSKMQNKTAFAEYESRKERNSTGIYINTKKLGENVYSRIIPFEEKIDVVKKRIESSEKTIELIQSKMGLNKKADSFLKKELKTEKRVLSDLKFAKTDIEDSIKKGEKPLPYSISSIFKDIKQQLKCTIHHEFGHHVEHEMGDWNTKEIKRPSLYGKANWHEYFAEYYAKYRMVGEDDIPDELLNIFKSWENGKK